MHFTIFQIKFLQKIFLRKQKVGRNTYAISRARKSCQILLNSRNCSDRSSAKVLFLCPLRIIFSPSSLSISNSAKPTKIMSNFDLARATDSSGIVVHCKSCDVKRMFSQFKYCMSKIYIKTASWAGWFGYIMGNMPKKQGQRREAHRTCN